MRALIRTVAAAALVGLAGCSTVIVDTDYDRSVDFSAVRTWAWDTSAASEPTPIDGLVRTEVEAGMQARGLERVNTAKPDVHVSFTITVAEEKGRTYEQPSYSYSRGAGSDAYWGKGGPAGHSWDYKEGTLLLVVADGSTGHIIWRGSAREVVDPERSKAERQALVNEAVTRMLADFPPGR